ncbi:MAG TPA: hypothetical protein VHW74_18035 [Mycobacteriales bacterium]|jgi:drug/metabolite transporter (DMT)-like permease|nr:hypothetical protein [Mycobacteriales bacterium]
MILALVIAVIGVLAIAWPGGLIRIARAYRGAMPADRTATTIRAARIAGVLLIIAALLIALANG